MSTILLLDIINLFIMIMAACFMIKGWKRVSWGNVKFFLAALIAVLSLHSLSNIIEWSGYDSVFLVWENYFQVLVPLVWSFFFYAFIQEDIKNQIYHKTEQFRSLVENTINWLWQTDQNGFYIYSSPQCREIIGYDAEEIIGKNLLDLMLSHDLEHRHKEFQKLISCHKKIKRFESIFVHKNGSLIIMETSAVPVFDEMGKVCVGYSGINRDVTEQKLMEQTLFNERNRMKLYLEIAPIIFLVLDEQGSITLINKKGHQILGYTEQEVLRKNWFENFLPERFKKDMRGVFNKLMSGDLRFTEYFENPVVTKSGEERIIAWHNSPLKDDNGKIIGIISSGEDITDRKKDEEKKKELAAKVASAAVESKKAQELTAAYEKLKKAQAQLVEAERLSGIGQLAAGVAHELNSPLTGLLSLLKTYLRKAQPDSRQREELQIMTEAAEYMANIVKGLISFSRQSKGEFVDVNFNIVIESTLSFVQHQFKNSNIRVLRKYDGKLISIKGHKSSLQQVVLNMISNAIDAMPQGGEIIIKTKNIENNTKIMVEFIDNGEGIAGDNLTKIFDPFFTTKGPGKGVGLGLSISHGIIKKHHGEVFVDSHVGKGTRFELILPGAK
ncbi:MAG: PAS domain S-box protein [Candidatus Omnitrophota bacterium]